MGKTRKFKQEASTASVGEALDELNLALGQYMLALTGSFQPSFHDGVPSGKPRFFSFPGFLLAVRETWLFVTAGHNLQAVLRASGDKLNNWTGIVWTHFMVDALGVATRSLDNTVERPLYFGCDVPERDACENIVGTEDWGVLELTMSERQWMTEAGVKPFTVDELASEFDAHGYVLIGLPTALFGRLKVEGHAASSSVNPTIIGLKKRDDLIERARGLWFAGDIPDQVNISILGMSGGPLFAFDRRNWRVRIAGVQSYWWKKKRIAFVCPITTILQHLPAQFRP